MDITQGGGASLGGVGAPVPAADTPTSTAVKVRKEAVTSNISDQHREAVDNRREIEINFLI